MNERIIFSNACLSEGIESLSENDAVLKEAFKLGSPMQLRLREPGFSNLVSVIVSQQISVAAADSILKKMGHEMISSEELITAAARINYQDLESLESNKVIEILTNVLGIGRWTAEIYLMFSLGRANIFPAGDLALQEAYRILYKLPERPNEKKMRDLAGRWSPWMSISARGLWSYYSHVKRREGIR